MSLLRIAGLEQRAGAKVLLKGINLEIQKGEFFVIIGPTGAGKTTLIRLLDLLDSPYAGHIYVDGLCLTGPGVDQVQARRKMSAVFQKPAVFNMSVFENIAYPLKLRRVPGGKIRSRVEELLELTGLKGYAKRKARTLSGGEAQRVALARAMASNPELLLLDEPTANLDPLSSQVIEDLITRFNKAGGVTVVMSTHDMKQAQRLADRVGVLMSGEFVQVGDVAGVFESPENTRVAGFVGIRNILRGRVESREYGVAVINIDGRRIEAVCNCEVGEDVNVCIRPEDIILSRHELSSSARNSLACTVSALRRSAAVSYVGLDCGFRLEALVTSRSVEQMMLREGGTVFASFKATSAKILQD
jgi:tungstate transport system ATP-binding protein